MLPPNALPLSLCVVRVWFAFAVRQTKRMEESIQTDFAQEIQVLQLKLEVVERELAIALGRAESAEAEVGRLRTTPPPPPTPPTQPLLPPPPPPPMPPPPPAFNSPPVRRTPGGQATTLFDQINGLTLNDHTADDQTQQVGQAKGKQAHFRTASTQPTCLYSDAWTLRFGIDPPGNRQYIRLLWNVTAGWNEVESYSSHLGWALFGMTQL